MENQRYLMGLEGWPCHSKRLGPRESHPRALSPTFLICEMGITIICSLHRIVLRGLHKKR